MRMVKGVLALVIFLVLAACKAEASPLLDDNQEEPQIKEEAFYVDIKGAIRNPGVYKVSEGSRLMHLIELSGGTTKDAVLNRLTLSERLSDGSVYTVPSVHDTPDDEAGDEPPVEEDGENPEKVSINHASKEALQTLPSIGPATAQGIIDYREEHGDFETKEALMDVKNIGKKTFADLEDLITLQP